MTRARDATPIRWCWVWRVCALGLVLLAAWRTWPDVWRVVMGANSWICVDGSGDICIDGSDDVCITVNDCYSCDPPLDISYQVVLSGLGGDFAAYAGSEAWSLGGSDPCGYSHPDASTDEVFLYYDPFDMQWKISLVLGDPECQILLVGPATVCDPTGSYTLSFCLDSVCTDTDSCDDSTGAAATVSEVP